MRFRSNWLLAVRLPNNAVTLPNVLNKTIAWLVTKKQTWNRNLKYIPAVTLVAACISADTGVGPSLASGNHKCSLN